MRKARRISSLLSKWTWQLFLLGIFLAKAAGTPTTMGNVEAFNITREQGGDLFFITGGDCGVTRCMEITGGTAMMAAPPEHSSAEACSCRCSPETPLFREDKLNCVDNIAECPVIDFREGTNRSKLPLIFLPLFGQIIHPSKTLEFPEVKNAVCAVSSSQYLTKTGWSSLRNSDGDVPFMFYRDEGRTYLQWKGNEEARAIASGRLILVKLTCRLGLLLLSPCVAFRVQGTPINLPHDVSEVWFSGDVRVLSSPREASDSTTGPSNDSSSAIHIMGFMGIALLLCAVLAIILYGTILLCYIKNKRIIVQDDAAGGDEIVYGNEQINPKTNPLLRFLNEQAKQDCKDNSTHRGESSTASSDISTNKYNSDGNFLFIDKNLSLKNNVCTTSTAVVHKEVTNKRPSRGARCMNNSSTMERCPEVHVSIIEGPIVSNSNTLKLPVASVPVQRKKLYFNPSFFEPHFLRSPPPAALEFLTKIREVIKVAKEKMMNKRFTPSLPVIVEEKLVLKKRSQFESFNSNHLMKRDSGKSKTCVGCPGCTERKFKKTYLRTLSEREFCKSCVTTEFKQDIIRKWLDDVPIVTDCTKNDTNSTTKSISSVIGTPNPVEPLNNKDDSGEKKRRKKLPPPPPPPTVKISEEQNNPTEDSKKKDEDLGTSKELKQKMKAVINELTKFKRVDAITPRSPSPAIEVVTPFIPKAVVPITPKVIFPAPVIKTNQKSNNTKIENKNLSAVNQLYEIDSLERAPSKRRASLSNLNSGDTTSIESNKRRSSIIAMEELEPMKKIHDMNSRLSRSYQGLGATDEALEDSDKWYSAKWETYSIKRKNLVSEVIINDAISTFKPCETTKKSEIPTKNTNVQYTEPVAKPGQLVIKVEDPPQRFYPKEEDDFDPDTLDRKPDKSRQNKEYNNRRLIDKMLLKSVDSFKTTWESEIRPKPIKKVGSEKIRSLREIYEAKLNDSNYRYFGSSYETLNNIAKNSLKSGPRSLDPYFDTASQKTSNNNLSSSFTSKTLIKPEVYSTNTTLNPTISFKITKSEPPMDYYSKDYTESPLFYKRNILENNNNYKLLSLDPTCENIYTLPDRVKSKKDNKRANGKSVSRIRHQKMHQSKFHKTEDSGYLSSDSNESRKTKRKFILQVKDRDEEITDTDEAESVGDARSESGGESIETNSVFFGSLRRINMMRKQRADSCKTDEDGKSEKDCANIISVVLPTERLPELDNL